MKDEAIGIIPAGGSGKRMAPFKVWKELIHVGYKKIKIGDCIKLIPKIVAEYTIENMVDAGAEKIVMVLNDQKYDVFRFFRDGSDYGTSMVYTCQNADASVTGMPVAIDSAYPWVKGKTVFMGMPDTIVEPFDSFKSLFDFHKAKNADLTLGVFPTKTPYKFAPVSIEDKTSRVTDIFDKPKNTNVCNTWGMAVWSANFTELLHEHVQRVSASERDSVKEILLSDIFLEAVHKKMNVYGLLYPEGSYHDLGDINDFISSRTKIENSIISEKDKIS